MAKNILLIVADDLGRNLGLCGESKVKTPNLDKLAAEGTYFDMAFASTASCSGSRSVMHSGLHTHETGQLGLLRGFNGLHYFTTFDHVETSPKCFNDIGYLTGIINKVHVGPDEVYPWQVREESATREVAWTAERSAAFFELAKSKEQPFFLTVGYIDPHRDLTRGGFGNSQDYKGVNHLKYDPADVTIPFFLSDVPEVREELAQYYSAIYRLDQGVGMLLKELSKAGFEDNTLVMFVSDNGPPFVNSKSTLYDAGVRLPMIVRIPGGTPNIVNPNLISFIDILPTFLDWAGHGDRKGDRQGRSVLPILSETKELDDWSHVFGSHTFHELTAYYPTRYMRTKRFKYHRNVAWQLDFPFAGDLYGALSWEGMRNAEPHMIGKRPIANYIKRGPEELFDLEADPEEVKNLAKDPKYQEQLVKCRNALEKWQLETKDPWYFRDGISTRVIYNHIDAGLKMPERWDFDALNPGNK
ncbi:alkaline-phosphatase-like protein [Xylogone sp. PMI_703]|nr:alkaline-phosphatase-like protein [Xylogone sp. PMI_703]